MTENVTNELLFETLKSMQLKISVISDDLSEMKTDMRGLKNHMIGFMESELAQDSSIASIKMRLDRIERRLEIRD